jgi:hypothetical protein
MDVNEIIKLPSNCRCVTDVKINWLASHNTVRAFNIEHGMKWYGFVHTNIDHFDCTMMHHHDTLEDLLNEMILFTWRLSYATVGM